MFTTENRADQKLITLKETTLVQATAASLRSAIEREFRPGDRVILDLSPVTFMDSTALGVLIGGLKVVGPTGSLSVIAPHRAVKTLFVLTRMTSLFAVVDRVEDLDRGAAA